MSNRNRALELLRQELEAASDDSSSAQATPTVCDTECTSIDPESSARFQLVRRLGKGGFGVVFLAVDQKLHRQVALKVPRSDILLTKSIVNRLMREALNAAKLDHPNIIPVLETDDSLGVPAIVYHYCDGPTLSQWRRAQRDPISGRTIASIGLHLAEAVQHAHSRGILHRDLKPGNILLEACPRDSLNGFQDGDCFWVPRITDFGISKAIDVQESETLTGTLMGTPEYMSPEQLACRSRDVGTHSDVYSLGVILYELATGSRPFTGRLSSELLLQIQQSEPSTVRKNRDDIPKDLEAIILRCLSYDERRRYPSATALADDLCAFLENRPVIARPPTRLGQWCRWARRQPLIAALSVCCGVLLLTAALLAWSHYRQTTHLVSELQESNSLLLRSRQQADKAREQSLAIAGDLRQTLYASDMASAYKALHDRDLPAYDSLLQKQVLGDDQDARDAVWNYLWLQGHRDPSAEFETSQSLYSIKLSSTGKYAAIGGMRGTVNLIDLECMESIQEWDAGHGELNCAEFSPDDRHLATVGDDGHVRVWEFGSKEAKYCFRVHPGIAFQVAFLDHNTIITCGNETPVRIWDLESGREVGKLEGHGGSVQRFYLSEDRRTLVSGSDDSSVCVWDMESKKLLEKNSDSNARVMDVESGNDRSWVLSADMAGCLRMRTKSIDAESPTNRLVAMHKDGIESVTSCVGEKLIAAGTRGGAIHLYTMDSELSARLSKADMEVASWLAHDGRVYDLIFSKDGKSLYSVAEDGRLRKWELDPNVYPRTLTVSDNLLHRSIKPSAMTQISKESCAFSGGSSIYRWNAETGDVEELAKLDAIVHRLVASRDGQFLFSAQLDGSACAWRLGIDGATFLWRHKWPHPNSLISGLAYCESGQFVVCSVEKPEIRMAAFRIDDGEPLMSWGGTEAIQGNHEGALDVTSNGKWIAIGGGNNIGIFSLHSSKPKVLELHSNFVSSLAFSPNMKYLLAGSEDRTLSLWNVEDWTLVAKLTGHRQRIASVAWSDDGRLFVSSGEAGETKIWHAEALREMIDVPGPTATARMSGLWRLPRLFRTFHPHTLRSDLFK